MALCAVKLSLVLVSTQVFHTNLLYFGDDGLVARFAGTAPRPYAYRVLTDWLLRGVAASGIPRLPLRPLDAIATLAQASQHAVPAASFMQIKAYAILATLFAFGFLVFVYLASVKILNSYLWAGLATLLAALLVNAIQLQGYGQPYDYTTLFFAALLFWMITIDDNWLFSACFPAACLAKESLFLLAIVSTFVSSKGNPRLTVLVHLAFRTTVFLVIYGWERAAFSGNSGSPIYHNVGGHIHMLVEHVDINAICNVLFALVLPFYRLPFKHPALRRGLLIVPILAALYVWAGNPGEFRIVFEVLPILVISAADSLQRLVIGESQVPGARI